MAGLHPASFGASGCMLSNCMLLKASCLVEKRTDFLCHATQVFTDGSRAANNTPQKGQERWMAGKN